MSDADAPQVPIEETHRFVRSVVRAPVSVLEIGCGDGRLAAALAADGDRVIAIDSDPATVTVARTRGVDARVARFPGGPDGPFDAVLFTRSLHHVGDLSASLAAAARRLVPGGVVLVEDWAWEVMDAALLTFCARLSANARERGGVVEDAWETGEAGLAAWQHEHGDHGLHTGAAIAAALRARFENVTMTLEPYAYRYPARYLAAVPGAGAVVTAALTEERRALAAGMIPALGRRWVARDLCSR